MKIEYKVQEILKTNFRYENNILGHKKVAIYVMPHKKALAKLEGVISTKSVYAVPGRFILKVEE